MKKVQLFDVQSWLDQNHPKYKILKWGGKASDLSKFLDTKRNVEFDCKFSQLKSKLKKDPNRIFGATKEEKLQKQKETCLREYGSTSPLASRKVQEKIRQTNLKKRGVENPFSSEEIKEKIRQTNLKKWGVENPSQLKEIKDKTRRTNFEKYGGPAPASSAKVQEKIKKTTREKYGVEHFSKTDEFKRKTRETSLKNWGVEHPLSSCEIREKINQTNIENYGNKCSLHGPAVASKKVKTWMEKWGVDNPNKSSVVREKIEKTNIKKYGSRTFLTSNEGKKVLKDKKEQIYSKIKKTNIKNGNWNYIDEKSVPEWAQDPQIASANTIYKAVKVGIHPLQVKSMEYSTELAIKEILAELNIKNFAHNKKLPELKGKKIGFKNPDFLLLDHKLIIEADGDTIHGNPKFYGPNDWVGHPKSPILAKDKWKIDQEANLLYESFGYKVLRFWEDEIFNNIENVKQKICLFLN